jgi:hypothetical protein
MKSLFERAKMKSEERPGTFTSTEDEKFFGAIGRLVISWAHLELGLDVMVEILYRGFNGNEIEAEMPRNLLRKITFLRAMFIKLLGEGEGSEGYRKFFDRVQAASQTRHDIIHGVVVEQVERSGEATIMRAIRNRDGIIKRRISVTTHNILTAAVEAQKLGGNALYWVDVVVDYFKLLPRGSRSQNNGEALPDAD